MSHSAQDQRCTTRGRGAPGVSGARTWRLAGFEGDDISSCRAAVEGIVLAGVHAWGDSVLERVTCWPLVPIASRPLISHSLEWFHDAGIVAANICANSDTKPVCRCLGSGDELGIRLSYYEDVMPRGPAGCIGDVMLGSDADIFVVVDGTVVPKINLADLVRAHEVSGSLITVAATSSAKGIDGSVIPVGVSVFSRGVAEWILPIGYQDIKETLIPKLRSEELGVGTYMVEDTVLPRVRCAGSYLSVNKWAIERICRDEAPTAYVAKGESHVHTSAQLDPSVRLIGPVFVEPGCVIQSGAVIVGPTTIGKGSVVGADAIVSRSAVWSNAQVGAGAIVDDCVLTDGAAVKPGEIYRQTVVVPK